MMEDTSIEFDMFEDARRKLVEIFEGEGHAPLKAEKIALYVVQGIREMPKLLTVLSEFDSRSHAQILVAVRAVLDKGAALDKARVMLDEADS